MGKSDSHFCAVHVKSPRGSVEVKSIDTTNVGSSSGFPPHCAHLLGPREVASGSFRNMGEGGWGEVPGPTSQGRLWKLCHVGLGSTEPAVFSVGKGVEEVATN